MSDPLLRQEAKSFKIHPMTSLGYVWLTVADLDQQIQFYQEMLGFSLHWREGDSARLGAGQKDLLRLTEVPGALRHRGTTGIYHFALLYPSRRELAKAVARLFERNYPNYPTDHVVSKTTYLDDPEGNNIELYIYSQEDGVMKIVNGELEVRHADGRPSNGREPLDIEALFREMQPGDRLDEPLPFDVKMGHVHLYGSNLEAMMHFYRDILGFKEGGLMANWRMGDVGLDRPHVIAFNTWQGEGAPPPPADSLGLRYFTVVLPDEMALQDVIGRVHEAGLKTERRTDGWLTRDPSQINILLTVPDLV